MFDAEGTLYAFALPVQPLAGVPMKLLVRLPSPLAALVAGAALAALTSLAQAQTKWDLPAAYPATNYHTENLVQFANDVDKATGGNFKITVNPNPRLFRGEQLQITVHPNASLLKANQIKRALQGGQAQIGEVLLVNFQNEWQLFGIDGLPFL